MANPKLEAPMMTATRRLRRVCAAHERSPRDAVRCGVMLRAGVAWTGSAESRAGHAAITPSPRIEWQHFRRRRAGHEPTPHLVARLVNLATSRPLELHGRDRVRYITHRV